MAVAAIEKTVVENEFTIIHYPSGSNVSFNHRSLTIKYVSVTGASFVVEHEDDEWVDMMQQHKLWR